MSTPCQTMTVNLGNFCRIKFCGIVKGKNCTKKFMNYKEQNRCGFNMATFQIQGILQIRGSEFESD